MNDSLASTPGGRAASSLGIPFTEIPLGDATSAADAARVRGVTITAVVKSLLVRRGEDDYLLVLVSLDRSISWPKLRAALGVSRLSMPNAETALAVTGYQRGTISPLGLDLPVIVDERLVGQSITLGSGQPGTIIGLQADDVIAAFGAVVADVSE
ncbi:MAG: YbaK/EbsC family protein [Actinomycetota bacterium]|nr:YbaK/EbsC family protein [Actinomycetota bacterium]